jgi:hypothetical protein
VSINALRRSLATLGLAAALFGAVALQQVSRADAGAGLRYVRGYSVQGSWLCYGWSTGIYHCTQHWHRSGSRLISDNAPFVPNLSASGSEGGQGGTGPNGPVNGGTTSISVTSGQPCHDAVKWPSSIGQWTVPSGCYAKVYMPNPASYASRPSYGWCNWWPEVLHPSYAGSSVLHLAGHSTPKPGAVVFFAGGVQGASSAGHYAQVVAIKPGSTWVLITEMNFSWRGAGFKKVDYRFIHTGSGVSFRY